MAEKKLGKVEPWHLKAAREFAGEKGKVEVTPNGFKAINPKHSFVEAHFFNHNKAVQAEDERAFRRYALVHRHSKKLFWINEKGERIESTGDWKPRSSRDSEKFQEALSEAHSIWSKSIPTTMNAIPWHEEAARQFAGGKGTVEHDDLLESSIARNPDYPGYHAVFFWTYTPDMQEKLKKIGSVLAEHYDEKNHRAYRLIHEASLTEFDKDLHGDLGVGEENGHPANEAERKQMEKALEVAHAIWLQHIPEKLKQLPKIDFTEIPGTPKKPPSYQVRGKPRLRRIK